MEDGLTLEPSMQLSTSKSKAERAGGQVAAVQAGAADHRLAYSIKEAASASGLSRSLLYLAIAQRKLLARKCRGRTVVLREDLQEFLATLPSMKATAA
jgi:hypothetical protein